MSEIPSRDFGKLEATVEYREDVSKCAGEGA
jgi:hypothetical protein